MKPKTIHGRLATTRRRDSESNLNFCLRMVFNRASVGLQMAALDLDTVEIHGCRMDSRNRRRPGGAKPAAC